MFALQSKLTPQGDQIEAIARLCEGIESGKRFQVLLGITGSGKTFTMAHVIERLKRPTLILAHNKTLAAQLYQELKGFFPDNAVEYFVSYYDYYQPEAYIARTDTYIGKELSINDRIDKLRLRATCSLLERRDVIIVSSVSCIYGLGLPDYFRAMKCTFRIGDRHARRDLLTRLTALHYVQRDRALVRSGFHFRGDILEIIPSYADDYALRVEFCEERIAKMHAIDPVTGNAKWSMREFALYPASHHVMPEEVRLRAIETIREELEERKTFFASRGLFVEAQRIEQRTLCDLEMIEEMGYCKGVENYSRHFEKRIPGLPPPCLLDYFPSDYLLFVDESHQTLPQIRAMYRGDRARKKALVDFGFRLPCAYDNRPLRFEEFYARLSRAVFVSATPGSWEFGEAKGSVVEQIIRPTGLLDPRIEMRPALHQVDDCLEEVRGEIAGGRRVLVTTLTKKLAEDFSHYLREVGIRAEYLHSDITALERVEIINHLRRGVFDVLVGVNLLREGLDIPEVALVAILDADKEGFLRSETSLMQTCGRAARNVQGRVIMYADKETKAIASTLAITKERRKLQEAYNRKYGIIPRTISKGIFDDLSHAFSEKKVMWRREGLELSIGSRKLRKKIIFCEREMKKAAKEYRFDDAIRFRKDLHYYRNLASPH